MNRDSVQTRVYRQKVELLPIGISCLVLKWASLCGKDLILNILKIIHRFGGNCLIYKIWQNKILRS